MESSSYLQKIVEHSPESAPVVLTSGSFTAAVELLAGVDPSVSLESVLSGAAFVYGIWPLVKQSGFRECVRRFNRLPFYLQEGIPPAVAALLSKPLLYYLFREKEFIDGLQGTLGVALGNLLLAYPVLYVADVCRPFLLEQETKRKIPQWLQQKNSSARKKLVYGALVTLLTLTSLMYYSAFNSQSQKKGRNTSLLETVIEQPAR